MKKIIILLSVWVLFYTADARSSTLDSLVGVWQDNENLGSGWSNTFLFFGDGTYKFFANQMNCAKRLISYSGKWGKSNIEEAIHLTVEEKNIISGGVMEKSDGSCASDSMLTGGSMLAVIINPAEEMDYSISKVYIDNSSGLARKFIYIDAVKYWYFGDPAEMLKQFENK